MIHIVDYGLGNVAAFINAYKRENINVEAARTAADVRAATRLILPGVGAFDHAMTMLSRSGMREALTERVLGAQVPVLGVCVGMQLMARSSEEGRLPGLGWIEGNVLSFKAMGLADLRLPHMGWNDVSASPGAQIFTGLESFARFYFLHSYFWDGVGAGEIAGVATYGREFCCAISTGNIHGVQFHPEKSHGCGIQLLKNFAEL